MQTRYENLIKLIRKAKGDRSINQFSMDCRIDSGHLSRILNAKFKNPPSPDWLNKIADNSYNNVTHEELMDAAGYLNLESKEIKGEQNFRFPNKKVEYLIEELYKAGILKEGQEPDDKLIEIIIEHAKTTAKAFEK